MKLTTSSDFSEASLKFAKQLGVTHLKINSGELMDERQRGPVQLPKLLEAKKKIEAYGLQIGVALLPQGVGSQHWNIRLGRPEREQEIEDVCRSIEILGQEGIPVVEYVRKAHRRQRLTVFNLAAVFGSESKPSGRGGATVRHFNYEKAKQAPPEPIFAANAVWERITWFLKLVVPVAETAGVKLACHPDDPPVPTIKGETRVLGSLEGMKRLIEIVPSEANGLNFCQGTVAEMGVFASLTDDFVLRDVIETIRYFGSRGKIHHVHFRNIKGSVPRFDESFIDDGDVDMLEALRTYKEVHDALESLPESDRTVLTLYYLGGLTCEEIARFMGTSRVAIKNRLYRARLSLKKEMIKMIQETWGTFQLPPTSTQRIMERIHYLKPTPTPISKPLAPWIAATMLVVVALFFGLGVMQSARFQLPYSLDDTESAMTVEINEAPFFEMPISKRTVGNRTGLSHTRYLGNGSQSNGSALALAADSQKGEDPEETGWKQTNGPYGGIVLTLLVTSKGTLYAGTQGAGIFRSSDGDNSWTPVNTGLTVYEDDRIPTIFSLAIMGNTLYVGTGGDIFRSVNGGDSWQQVTWFRNKGVLALAVMDNTLYVGRAEDGVLRSTDGGDSWSEVNTGLTNLHIRELVVMGTILYAGTDDGVFRSTDGGDSWTPINTGLTAPHYDLEEINKAQTESGAIPVPIDELAINRRVDSFAVSGNTLYMGMVNGLFRSVDEGNSWAQISSEAMMCSVSALSASGTTLYAGTFGGGVFRSTGGGDSWIPINTGLTNRIIHSLLAVEGTLYVGTSGGGIFRLADGEGSWMEINNGLTNTTVRNLVFWGNTLYGATDNGIIKSVDEGKSWTTVNTGLMISQEFPYVSALVVSGRTLYAATTTGPRGGVFRLEDGGNSWVEVNSKLSSIRSLVVTGTTFYAGTSGDGIFRLEEGDDSWTYLGVPNQYIESLAVSGTKLYAGTALGGIFRSVDGGKSWTQVNEGLTNRSIQSLVFVGTMLYAGTFGNGVFCSTDSGDSWTQINAGLTDTTITVLSVSGTTLYAGTHYHGVFRLEEGDDSWKPVGQMRRDVRSLAVSETTIYAGTMDGGVFRISPGK